MQTLQHLGDLDHIVSLVFFGVLVRSEELRQRGVLSFLSGGASIVLWFRCFMVAQHTV